MNPSINAIGVGWAVICTAVVPLTAANLTLTPGSGPGPMPADLTGGPMQIVEIHVTNPLNQGGTLDPGDFTVTVESVVTQGGLRGGLAFWYMVNNVPRRGVPSTDLTGLDVSLSYQPARVEVNQVAGENVADTGSFLAALGFDYTSHSIAAGERSGWLVVYTEATQYELGSVVVTGGGSQAVPALVPIPESGAGATVTALALAGAAVGRWRRVWEFRSRQQSVVSDQ
jgi:hypothetical protein